MSIHVSQSKLVPHVDICSWLPKTFHARAWYMSCNILWGISLTRFHSRGGGNEEWDWDIKSSYFGESFSYVAFKMALLMPGHTNVTLWKIIVQVHSLFLFSIFYFLVGGRTYVKLSLIPIYTKGFLSSRF